MLRAGAFALLLGAMAATTARAAPAAELSLLDIRFGDHTETTRVVLDLSGPTRYRAFALSQPHRIVVDMPPMTARVAASGHAGVGLVLGYRFARFSASASRLVLDVAAPARIERSFLLPPEGGLGHRLVIDLRRSTAAAPAPGRPAAAAAAPAPRTPLPTARPGPRRLRTIAVDAGHGGADPGAIGANGVYEKDLTLPYARALKRALEAVPGYRVVLTRDRDEYIPLRRRIAIAREAGAELFVSLHADSLKNRATRGASVYTLSETASDKEAAALAAKENRSDIIAGVNLNRQNDEVTSILIDLTQRETKNRSARYANLLLAEIRKSARVLKRSHRFAGFAVLKAPDVPSVLVELGYLSNHDEARFLASASGRRTLVAAIVRATRAYFRQTEALE